MSVSQESRKRDHESFNLDHLADDLERPFHVPLEEIAQPDGLQRNVVEGGGRGDASSGSDATSSSSFAAGLVQVAGESPSPSSAFEALDGSGPNPAKKAKLTFAEKEMKRINKEIKEQEKVAEKVRKEADRLVQVEEKARRDAEKEVERRKKEVEREDKRLANEAERRKKDAEREDKKLASEADKAAKEDKKRRKEEEKQRSEEEKRKKERSQKTLSSFFNIPASAAARRNSLGERSSMSPAPSNPSLLGAPVASSGACTPSKPGQAPYEKIFPDFFVYPNVTMAPINRFELDEEASELLQHMVDSYILQNRSPRHQRTFDSISLFRLSGLDNIRRGKRSRSVKDIMAESSGKSSSPIDLTTDSQNSQIKRTNELLRKIPLKFLKFQEDVRPPYRGTYTSRPVNGMEKLARNPLRRDLPNTNYDYDSEAEWVEDEDAEDLNSEGEEDEDVGEDGEDMEGFLDDENDDIANSKRLVLQGDLEPVSTGLCWENRKRANSNVKLMPYRMEIILDPAMKSIDPFSTQYWTPAPLPATATMEPPRFPLNTLKPNSSIVNGPFINNKAVKPFFATSSDSQKPTKLSVQAQPLASSAAVKPKKFISADDLHSFKAEIQGSDLSKVGLIEVLKKKFPGRPGAAIKATLEVVAKRVGLKEADKRWVLIEDEGGRS